MAIPPPPPPGLPVAVPLQPQQQASGYVICGKRYSWGEIAAAVVAIALVAIAGVMLLSHIPSGVIYALLSSAGLIIVAGVAYKVYQHYKAKKQTPPPPYQPYAFPPPYPTTAYYPPPVYPVAYPRQQNRA